MISEKQDFKLRSIVAEINAIALLYEETAIELIRVGILQPKGLDKFVKNKVTHYFKLQEYIQ